MQFDRMHCRTIESCGNARFAFFFISIVYLSLAQNNDHAGKKIMAQTVYAAHFTRHVNNLFSFVSFTSNIVCISFRNRKLPGCFVSLHLCMIGLSKATGVNAIHDRLDDK